MQKPNETKQNKSNKLVFPISNGNYVVANFYPPWVSPPNVYTQETTCAQHLPQREDVFWRRANNCWPRRSLTLLYHLTTPQKKNLKFRQHWSEQYRHNEICNVEDNLRALNPSQCYWKSVGPTPQTKVALSSPLWELCKTNNIGSGKGGEHKHNIGKVPGVVNLIM